MIYGYIRVSTDRQTVDNQRFEIRRFCRRQGLAVDGWIAETISGTTPCDRRELGRLLRTIASGDLIICSELSRLGRNLFMIMEILSLCMQRGCRSAPEKYKLHARDAQARPPPQVRRPSSPPKCLCARSPASAKWTATPSTAISAR